MFEHHAIRRMAERGIAPDSVHFVLDDPEWSVEADSPGYRQYVRRINGKPLSVIAKLEIGGGAAIKSCYWMEEEDCNE